MAENTDVQSESGTQRAGISAGSFMSSVGRGFRYANTRTGGLAGNIARLAGDTAAARFGLSGEIIENTVRKNLGQKERSPFPSRAQSQSRGGRKPPGGGRTAFDQGGLPPENSFRSILNEPKSARVNYDSGLKAGLLVDPIQPNRDNWSPVYLSHGSFLRNVDGTKLEEYLTKDALLMINAKLQQNINFNVFLTVTEIKNWFKYVSSALQLHYMIDSIMVYSKYKQNNNRGMLELRKQMSPNVLGKWGRLIEILQIMVVPPALLDFIRFMYQNHSFTDAPGAPIVRIGYRSSLKKYAAQQFSGNIEVALDEVINELLSISVVNSKLSKAFPEHIITSLPPSSAEVLVDHNFHTFWHNQLIRNDANLFNYSTTTASPFEEDFLYGSCTNDLDGSIFACWGAYYDSAIPSSTWDPQQGDSSNPDFNFTSTTAYNVAATNSGNFIDLNKDIAKGSMIFRPICRTGNVTDVEPYQPSVHTQIVTACTLNIRRQAFHRFLSLVTTL